MTSPEMGEGLHPGEAPSPEQAGEAFLRSVMEERRALFVEAIFEGPADNFSAGEVDDVLMKRIRAEVDDLDLRLTGPFGVSLRYRPIGADWTDLFPVKVGWVDIVPVRTPDEDYEEGTDFPHSTRVTDAGRMVVNGHRAAQGLVDAAEQRKRNRQFHSLA